MNWSTVHAGRFRSASHSGVSLWYVRRKDDDDEDDEDEDEDAAELL
jgi:hypothetical protein